MAEALEPVSQVRRPNPKPEDAGAKVAVYLNHPTGIVIQRYQFAEYDEMVLGGGVQRRKISEPVGPAITLYGNRPGRQGTEQTHMIVANHGVTHGVPKDLWDWWIVAYKDMPLVRNGLIFAHEDSSRGEAQARAMRDERSGLEALMKDGDPRAPRPAAGLHNIKDGDRAAA